MAPQFLRFLLVSAFAALANFCSRMLFSLALPLSAAVMLAFLVGMSTAFALNRKFVFTSTQTPIRVQAMWFVLVNLAALAQTLVVTLALAQWLLPLMGIVALRESLAHAAGIVAPAVTSYLLHKKLTFNDGIWHLLHSTPPVPKHIRSPHESGEPVSTRKALE